MCWGLKCLLIRTQRQLLCAHAADNEMQAITDYCAQHLTSNWPTLSQCLSTALPTIPAALARRISKRTGASFSEATAAAAAAVVAAADTEATSPAAAAGPQLMQDSVYSSLAGPDSVTSSKTSQQALTGPSEPGPSKLGHSTNDVDVQAAWKEFRSPSPHAAQQQPAAVTNTKLGTSRSPSISPRRSVSFSMDRADMVQQQAPASSSRNAAADARRIRSAITETQRAPTSSPPAPAAGAAPKLWSSFSTPGMEVSPFQLQQMAPQGMGPHTAQQYSQTLGQEQLQQRQQHWQQLLPEEGPLSEEQPALDQSDSSLLQSGMEEHARGRERFVTATSLDNGEVTPVGAAAEDLEQDRAAEAATQLAAAVRGGMIHLSGSESDFDSLLDPDESTQSESDSNVGGVGLHTSSASRKRLATKDAVGMQWWFERCVGLQWILCQPCSCGCLSVSTL